MNQTYFGILLFVSLFVLYSNNMNLENNFVYAESSIIIETIADSHVDEDLPEKKFGSNSNLAIGWTNSLNDENQSTKQALSYIKFKLDTIPESNDHEKITIDTVYLDISINETWWLDNNKHSLTIHPCFENSWIEEDITWNTRPCQEHLENGIRYDLNGSNIPKKNQFDITEIIEVAKEQNLSEITLVLSSCSTDKGRIDCQRNSGLIWIQSLENKDQDVNNIPKLDVQYTVEKKIITLYEIIIVVLSSITIVVFIVLFIQYIRRGRPFRRWKIRTQKTSHI